MSSGTRNGIIAAVMVVALIAGGAWWFLRDDSPEAVDQQTAASSVAESSKGDGATPVEDVSGTWSVDVDSGEFDFESATGTFAGFRVEEELSTIGSTTAVGRTGEVTGEILIDGTSVETATVEVDMTTITTDESRRDSKVQEALETDRFPTATFRLTEPIDLGAEPASGETISAAAVGDLTIHGETQAIELAIQAQLVDDTIVLTGSVDLALSEYGVEAPSAPIVVSVSDDATVEMQLLLTQS